MHNKLHRTLAGCVLLAAACPAAGQEQAQDQQKPQQQQQQQQQNQQSQQQAPAQTPTPQVQVSGARADQRQRDTIASIVIDHAEIIRHGDQTLADVLKRLPGISIAGTPGQGGAIQMRGLGNGYTQIMLNGEPVAAGFTLDSIAPELIERIEILRSATAELSNQAIAGGINIILRKAVTRGQRSLNASAARQAGHTSPALTAQLSDRVDVRGHALSYTVAATLSRKFNDVASLEWEEQWQQGRNAADTVTLLRRAPQKEYGRSDTLTLAPRLNWTLAGGDTLAWQGFANLLRLDNGHDADETALVGGNSAFPHNRATYIANIIMLRGDLTWTRQFDGGAKLELKLGAADNRRDAVFDFIGRDVALRPAGRHRVDAAPSESSATASGVYRHPLGTQHALALGWDASHALRDEDRRESLFAADGAPAGGSSAVYSATVRRLALFAQDEWEVTPRWSLYLGLRHESLNTVSTANAPNAANTAGLLDSRSAVWSPSLQSRFKLADKDILRFALSRTYKAPSLASLVPRRYTNDNNNNPTNPDEQGNPALRPELAWGLDGAYEHYLSGGALLSASAYLRRIRDVTQTRLFQQDGEWVESPFNDGNASMHGIELEARLPLRVLFAAAPALDLRANLSRNWSRVERVPGPDNRLEKQLPWSANMGADYRVPDSPWSIGGNLNLQAGGPLRLSPQLQADSNAKRELDLYGLYKAGAGAKTQWRIAASNLLRREASQSRTYTSDSADNGANAASVLRHTTLTPTTATLRITLEQQF